MKIGTLNYESFSFRIVEAERDSLDGPSDPASSVDLWETTVSDVRPGRFGGFSFTAPPYKDRGIKDMVFCNLFFERPSDGKVSDKVMLVYQPETADRRVAAAAPPDPGMHELESLLPC